MLWLLVTAAIAKPSTCLVGRPGTSRVLGHTTLTYVSGKELADNEALHAEAERREPAPIPVHGLLAFHVQRRPVQLENPDNHVIVVESEGKPIARREPDTPDPELPSGMRHRWGQLVVILPDEAAFPLTISAADRTLGHRCSWSVTWEGRVERL
jgi:hypothetical protein